MRCFIHDIDVPATEREDPEIACPECRQVWEARGDIYELSPSGGEQPPPQPD
jgi:Zn-finger nucleic acid-binding protein